MRRRDVFQKHMRAFRPLNSIKPSPKAKFK